MRRQEGRGEWTRRASAWPRLAKKIRAICDGRMAATAGREAHISSLATLHVVCGGAVQDCDAPFAYPRIPFRFSLRERREDVCAVQDV